MSKFAPLKRLARLGVPLTLLLLAFASAQVEPIDFGVTGNELSGIITTIVAFLGLAMSIVLGFVVYDLLVKAAKKSKKA